MANAAAPLVVSSKPTRRSIKAATGRSGQQKRRDEALQRQQAARQDFADHARQLATLAAGAPAQSAAGGDQARMKRATFTSELANIVPSNGTGCVLCRMSQVQADIMLLRLLWRAGLSPRCRQKLLSNIMHGNLCNLNGLQTYLLICALIGALPAPCVYA